MSAPSLNQANTKLGDQIGLLLEQVQQVTTGAAEITRVANEIHEGTGAQTRSLDSAVSLANEMSASMDNTATQAGSITTST